MTNNKPVLTPTIKIALIVGAVLFTCFGTCLTSVIIQDESPERPRSSDSSTDKPNSQRAESEKRFGLTLEERKKFYRRWVLAEDAAWDTGILNEEKLDQFQADLLSEYRLTKQQAVDISVEAFENNWPLPDVQWLSN